MNRLFYKIFAIFCMVIMLAALVLGGVFWFFQASLQESHRNQQRNQSAAFLRSSLTVFHQRGEEGLKELLMDWQNSRIAPNLFIIRGDSDRDILDRPIDMAQVMDAVALARANPEAKQARLSYDNLGEEYLFFIRDWHKAVLKDSLQQASLIPGLPPSPNRYEAIILLSLISAGLLLAFTLAHYIAMPIRTLHDGFDQLAKGNLKIRLAEKMHGRHDELTDLASDFDHMANRLQVLVTSQQNLLHHVSHEMRSPLARLQALLGLAQQQPEKYEKHLSRIEAELTRMDILIAELLTLSRLETGSTKILLEPIEFNEFLDQLITDCHSITVHHKKTILWSPYPEPIYIHANEDMLYRAFDNVIRNACTYAPDDSIIDIQLQVTAKWLLVNIMDQGEGIPPEQLAKIFDAFYRATTTQHIKGTGLGLSITKQIIEQHGGSVTAENLKPKGFTMHIVLPLSAAAETLETP
ncbi:MAG: HAMP domain-containing protein [Neisseriaceae bacterium]|nr:HAMP domain-containing protein [Neisseriaceae bacterium]